MIEVHVKFDLVWNRERQGPDRKPRWQTDIFYSETVVSQQEIASHIRRIWQTDGYFTREITIEKVVEYDGQLPR